MEWIVEQLTILGVTLDTQLSAQRLVLYAQALSDIGRESLALAFVEAGKRCQFFPRPAELRELAVGKADDQQEVEAQGAWLWIQDFMRKFWHADIGIDRRAPNIPPAINYTLRIIGGFRALSQMEVGSEPFVQKAFVAAFRLAPMAELMAPKLPSLLPTREATKLLSAKAMDKPPEPIDTSGLTQQAEQQERAAGEDQERRMMEGRQRHTEQVEWLKRNGQL